MSGPGGRPRTFLEYAALWPTETMVVEVEDEIAPKCPVDKECSWRGVPRFGEPCQDRADARLELEHIGAQHPEVLAEPPPGRKFWKTWHTTGRQRLTVVKPK
jgi:hypothetical protein